MNGKKSAGIYFAKSNFLLLALKLESDQENRLNFDWFLLSSFTFFISYK